MAIDYIAAPTILKAYHRHVSSQYLILSGLVAAGMRGEQKRTEKCGFVKWRGRDRITFNMLKE